MNEEERADMMLLSHIKGCFLDGKPALIYGRLNRFATVAQVGGPLEAEFSWRAVKRIMDKDRRFSS